MEIFSKPKPVLGSVQLLPLPGSAGWNGQLEPVITRAEQEAMALFSGGVDGILIENFYDNPYHMDRIDVAGAVTMAMIARKLKQFCNLPLGISVLRNDPETAFAVAINVGALFIRVPVLVGARIFDEGLAESRLQTLLRYRQSLKIPNIASTVPNPQIFADISRHHLAPDTEGSSDAEIRILKVVEAIERQDAADALILSEPNLKPEVLESLKRKTDLPILLENPGRLEDIPALYLLSDGLLISSEVKKLSLSSLDTRTTVDMQKVEQWMMLANKLRFTDSAPSHPHKSL